MNATQKNDQRAVYWYHLDLDTRKTIAYGYDGMSIELLELSVRSRNLLLRRNPKMDIHTLLLAQEDIAGIKGMGRHTLDEINSVMMSIIEGELVPSAPAPDVVEASASGESSRLREFAPRTLSPDAESASIVLLHLARRHQHALISAGIQTIGELNTASIERLNEITGIGEHALDTIARRLEGLESCVGAGGRVDWVKFLQTQGIQVLPPTVPETLTVDESLRQFPKILRAVYMAESKEREWIIVERRFGLAGTTKLTLEELGAGFDLTRERVRQVESRSLTNLRHMLLDQNHSGGTYEIHPELSSALRAFFSGASGLARSGILESRFSTELIERFKVSQKTLNSIMDFLIGLLQIRKVDFGLSDLEPVLYIETSHASIQQMRTVVITVHKTLSKTALALADVDLLIEANRALKKGARIGLEELRNAIGYCSTVEITPTGEYQAGFGALSTRADQLERVFIESGGPISVRDVTRRMNFKLSQAGQRTMTERNVGNQLAADSRFVPIGRSGEWALKRWEVDTDTIVELMKQYLTKRNEPATASEIYEYVRARRPASAASIASYLQFDNAFSQVTRDEWGLSGWHEVTNAQRWSPEQVGEFVENYFRSRKIQEVDYSLLKQALIEASGLSVKTVQGLLNSTPAISTERLSYKLLIAKFQPDHRQRLAVQGARRKRKKKTLTELIGERVKEMLQAAPRHQMPLAEIVDDLVKVYGKRYSRPRNVIYGYISRLDFVEKFSGADGKTVICRLVENHDQNLAQKARQIQTPALQSNVLRALNFLNESDVDLALMLLGKEFEATLRQYIGQAAIAGKLVTSVTANPKLNDLVNIVEKEGILTDKAVLHFLRQSRNDRAHGAMPSTEERKMMLDHIGVTAGMYIDHIKFFDDLSRQLDEGE